MLLTFKYDKHQQYLSKLPKILQPVDKFFTLYSPIEYRKTFFKKIASAEKRICISTLYLDNDEAGYSLIQALYSAKKIKPNLDISIIVDWHRAQRGRIGDVKNITNWDWYRYISKQNPNIIIPIYGIPVNIHEALGVLHLKGFIIDDEILYSGANINNVYFYQHNQYRYDRYHVINNKQLSDVMFTWIKKNLQQAKAVNKLDHTHKIYFLKNKIKIRYFHQSLRNSNYHINNNCDNGSLTITPLAGLGKYSILNKTICNLITCTKKKLIMCTPYFNLHSVLMRCVINLLREGKKVEIIVGDKTANDFYIHPDDDFKIIGILPYLYEINLRRFLKRLDYYVNNGQLLIRLWQHENNTYHVKGIWIDKEWILLTGYNFNPRSWYLDLENALLIHDPLHQISIQNQKELLNIRTHTKQITNFRDLEIIAKYPIKIRKIIRSLRSIHLDRIINHIL